MTRVQPSNFTVLIHNVLILGCALLSPRFVQADVIIPECYSMPNGGTSGGGGLHYWDLFYDGMGDTMQDYAFLNGGLGDLTDGIVAADNWNDTENGNGDGPYVGWQGFDPSITFEFVSPILIDRIRIHVDDSNGAGAVGPPESVTLITGESNQTFDVSDPTNGAPFWVEIDLAGSGILGSEFTITLNRSNDWVFASEFEFLGAVLGDTNLDGSVDLLDVAPFVQLLTDGLYQPEADMNGDNDVNLLDVAPFVDLLSN